MCTSWSWERLAHDNIYAPGALDPRMAEDVPWHCKGTTHGGFVIPCFDPVLIITAGFSWWSMLGTNVCCTFKTLQTPYPLE